MLLPDESMLWNPGVSLPVAQVMLPRDLAFAKRSPSPAACGVDASIADSAAVSAAVARAFAASNSICIAATCCSAISKRPSSSISVEVQPMAITAPITAMAVNNLNFKSRLQCALLKTCQINRRRPANRCRAAMQTTQFMLLELS